MRKILIAAAALLSGCLFSSDEKVMAFRFDLHSQWNPEAAGLEVVVLQESPRQLGFYAPLWGASWDSGSQVSVYPGSIAMRIDTAQYHQGNEYDTSFYSDNESGISVAWLFNDSATFVYPDGDSFFGFTGRWDLGKRCRFSGLTGKVNATASLPSASVGVSGHERVRIPDPDSSSLTDSVVALRVTLDTTGFPAGALVGRMFAGSAKFSCTYVSTERFEGGVTGRRQANRR
jgi:hypothetical protein